MLDVKNAEMDRMFNELMSDSIVLSDDLQQFKKDHKISIIPFIQFPMLTGEQNRRLFELEKKALQISLDKNDSNEVAIICAFDEFNEDVEYAVVSESEYEINLLADPETHHLLRSPGFNKIVVNIHNHPSCEIFSVHDIMFFLTETNLRLMVLLSNKGQLFYMLKKDNYMHNECRRLFTDIINKVHPQTFKDGKFFAGSLKRNELKQIAHNFLKYSINFGIEYRAV